METGLLIYRDSDGREYAVPLPYRPEVLEMTCRRTGWRYTVVPFVPKPYAGYYAVYRQNGLIYLLDLDTPNRYGFQKEDPKPSNPTVDNLEPSAV